MQPECKLPARMHPHVFGGSEEVEAIRLGPLATVCSSECTRSRSASKMKIPALHDVGLAPQPGVPGGVKRTDASSKSDSLC